ncbi:hypothetical protein Aca07nite_87610 [Actinoplanes capillaceus]|uniref:ARB-07466-like C-terminal domain-containing protein n=1 Tax=Actinoplanes campanulatus TaxID=113559 RepID=A0ABQ3WYX4_9ACTN|nr:hypothetical protein [Actinoplanes capillaceus]GID51486.1 hypothetical protein Aca07nite_87610 [Actinoplanes capillaceus]
MTTRLLYALIAVVVGTISLCAAGGAMLLGGASGASCTTPIAASNEPTAAIGSYDSEQVANAATIIAVGAQQRVPVRGWVIAIATALQESTLRNLDHGDRDSLGLFQQRPSQGWGTPRQLLDPVYASSKFYEKLVTIPDWQNMELTDAAQRVQISAHPDAYAKWEPDAILLVENVGSSIGLASPVDPFGAGFGCSAIGVASPAPRNPDGSWPEEACSVVPDPTTGRGCLTPRTLNLVQQTTADGWPTPNCYRVDDHGEHPKGRACDYMMTSGGEATDEQRARGDALSSWAVANASNLGIKYVIWYRMIWTDDDGWHPYNNPFGGNDPSGWHTNHVHISML